MPIRSITTEFGRKLEAVPQTMEVLSGADFGKQNFEPQINISADPMMIDPVANASRPSYTRRGLKHAEVTFKESITRGAADGTAPAFFPLLQAAGFTVGTAANADVATLGGMPSNDAALSCELFDGIKKKSAWGVRGNIEISADKPGDQLLVSFTGKGHGDEADQVEWPAGITDDMTPCAIFESNTMTIGGFSPEVLKVSFKTEGDPVQIGNGLSSDGISEFILSKVLACLRITAYQHTRAAEDRIASLRDSASNSHAFEWAIALDGGLELAIAGNVAVSKYANRAVENNVGVLPLEFAFLRSAPITITQRPKV